MRRVTGFHTTRFSIGATVGTWAEGGSLDYVGDLIDQLTNTVIGCFNDGNAALDEGGESELMPSVAIIGILSERCGAAPPKPKVIEEWRSKYLAIYDDQIDDLDPNPDYKVKRRKVIDDTFTELIERATKFWKP
jgi:hypothetical protein